MLDSDILGVASPVCPMIEASTETVCVHSLFANSEFRIRSLRARREVWKVLLRRTQNVTNGRISSQTNMCTSGNTSTSPSLNIYKSTIHDRLSAKWWHQTLHSKQKNDVSAQRKARTGWRRSACTWLSDVAAAQRWWSCPRV